MNPIASKHGQTTAPTGPFAARLAQLPCLGIGISTEFGARAAGGLEALRLRCERPDLVSFLEIGVDLERGVDADARAWRAAGLPATYHFLDLNLEEPEDLDPVWLAETSALARELGAAWICGDAGLWHMGPRERGHATLIPPILTAASADGVGAGVRAMREQSGFEILPENPPAHVYLGELHLLEYFARVCEQADCGICLDLAHLAIYQRATGHAPLDGLADFPLERVVELHVAGGTPFPHAGRTFIDDDHSPEPIAETWQILEALLPRAHGLRGVIYECERNRAEQVIPILERLASCGASA